jgi:hypothetical protein
MRAHYLFSSSDLPTLVGPFFLSQLLVLVPFLLTVSICCLYFEYEIKGARKGIYAKENLAQRIQKQL